MFKDVVRDDPYAVHVSYKNLESAMYRARREIEPPIPKGATELCQLIVSSDFGIYYKGEVKVLGGETGVIFFSDKMKISLSEADHIYILMVHFKRYHPSSINCGLFSPALDAMYCRLSIVFLQPSMRKSIQLLSLEYTNLFYN